jgi:hypothetical protein
MSSRPRPSSVASSCSYLAIMPGPSGVIVELLDWNAAAGG